MKVLLTGAGGFLGAHLARSLLSAGVGQLLLHFRQKAPAGMLEGLRRDFPDAAIEPVFANLSLQKDLQSVVQHAECVVHAAAGMRGATADMFANTVVGTRNLLEAAGNAGVRRVVLVSSFAVYRTVELPKNSVLTEEVATEAVGVEKGPYAFAKTRQEQIFQEMQARFGFETCIVRPGVIYGPGGSGLSPRVGIQAMGFFFSLGGSALLPLTYVENCADAIARVALQGRSGGIYNAVDDDLPTCRAYLRAYTRRVRKLRVVPVPFWLLRAGSRGIVRYHRASKGQLPAVMTPYIVQSMFQPLRYSNQALKELGWSPRIATPAGLDLHFSHLSKPAR